LYPSHAPLISVLNYLYRFPSVLFRYLRKVIILAFYAGMKGVGGRQSQEISSGKRQENWKLRAMDTHLSTSPFSPSSFFFCCLFSLDSSGQLTFRQLADSFHRESAHGHPCTCSSEHEHKRHENTHTCSPDAFEPEMPVFETKYPLNSADTKSNCAIAMVEVSHHLLYKIENNRNLTVVVYFHTFLHCPQALR
jgi:hypothetical protein